MRKPTHATILTIIIMALLYTLITCPKKQVVPETVYTPFTESSQPGDVCKVQVTSLECFGYRYTTFGTSDHPLNSVYNYYFAKTEDNSIAVVSIAQDSVFEAQISSYIVGSENYNPNPATPLTLSGEVMEMPVFGTETHYSSDSSSAFPNFSTDDYGKDDPAYQILNTYLKNKPLLSAPYYEPTIDEGLQKMRVRHIIFAIILGAVLLIYSGVLIYDKFAYRWMPAPSRSESSAPPVDFTQEPIPAGGWKCSCGRVHASYESSCVCGLNKNQTK